MSRQKVLFRLCPLPLALSLDTMLSTLSLQVFIHNNETFQAFSSPGQTAQLSQLFLNGEINYLGDPHHVSSYLNTHGYIPGPMDLCLSLYKFFFLQAYTPCASSKVSILASFDFILLCLHLLHRYPNLEITSSKNEFALIIQTSDRSCTFL